MGWFDDNAPAHEGFSVALLRDEQRGDVSSDYYRELTRGQDQLPHKLVDAVQAGCTCGWRSQRYRVTVGSVEWFPGCPELPKLLEERLGQLWDAHVKGLAEAERRGTPWWLGA